MTTTQEQAIAILEAMLEKQNTILAKLDAMTASQLASQDVVTPKRQQGRKAKLATPTTATNAAEPIPGKLVQASSQKFTATRHQRAAGNAAAYICLGCKGWGFHQGFADTHRAKGHDVLTREAHGNHTNGT